MNLEINIEEPNINQILDIAWILKEPAMIWGEPGLGKTKGLEGRAKREGYKLIPVLAGAMEPTDLGGIPFPYKNLYTKYLAPHWAFLCSNHPDVPEEHRGPTVIFFDDITTADEQTQSTFHKFVHEGIVGECRIRDNVRVFAAGNRVDDKSAARDMIKSLANRFVHFHAYPDAQTFIEWGREEGNIHSSIIAFLRHMPNYISTFQAALTSSEPAFATPRSWELLSRCLHKIEAGGFDLEDEESLDCNSSSNLVCHVAKGVIGKGVALEFNAFLSNTRGLVPPEDIAKDPRGVEIPQSLDKLWATVTAVEAWLPKNVSKWREFTIYALRMDKPEFGLLLARNIFKSVNLTANEEERLKALSSNELEMLATKWDRFFSNE